jgi:ribosomal protein S18 acetylase RimI-like enzyme
MSAPASAATVSPVPPADLLARLEAALEVYSAAMGLPTASAAIKRGQIPGHLRQPSARAVLATADGARLVGFGYGVAGQPGEFWYDRVFAGLMATGPAGVADARRWLPDSFEICELHVHPQWQGRGIGRTVLTELVAGAPYAAGLLSTEDIDSRARRLYHALGFTDLLTGFVFPGDPRRFAVLGVDLPLGVQPAAGAPAP